MQFFPHAEGYVTNTQTLKNDGTRGDNFNYVFNYLDHLGNIRMSYAWDYDLNVLKIIEENNYYPFGLKHTNYNSDLKEYKAVQNETKVELRAIPDDGISVESNVYKYKYNGKELQDELGLNMYDYGARNYDPALGRWMNIDPLAEQYRRWSPYNYCMDNPVIFTDPDGMYVDVAWIYQKDKKGNYKNKAIVEAFETFAKSKEGIAFLSNFAEKGQIIAGHEYKESGKYDKKKLILNSISRMKTV